MAVEEHLDLRLPRVAVDDVGELAGERRQAWLTQERIERSAGWRAAGDVVRILRGGRANRGRRKWQRCGGSGRVEFFRAEFFEQRQLLGERLRAIERARLAVGGVVETGLHGRRQNVFRPRRVTRAFDAVGQVERVFVGLGHGQDGVERRRLIRRLVVVSRRIGRFGLALVIDRARSNAGHGAEGQQQKDAQRRQQEGVAWVTRCSVHHQPPHQGRGDGVLQLVRQEFISSCYRDLQGLPVSPLPGDRGLTPSDGGSS